MSTSQSTYEKNLEISTIIATSYMVLSAPLYCYGIRKLSQFRQHILVQKRFPIVSYLIILLSLLSNLSHCIVQWIHYTTGNYDIPRIATGLSLFIYGLINLRLCLIYLQWKQNIKPSESIISVHNNKRNIYYHCCSISILIFSLCSSIYTIATLNTSALIVAVCWLLQIIISIAFAVIIVANKVREGLGCIKETVILLLVIIVPSVLSPLGSISSFMPILKSVINNLCLYLLGLVPLYFPLYYIRKMEGNLNVENMLFIKLKKINAEDPFFEFIESKDNYLIFSQYLSYCWALENLLFYQKVSVLYQMVLKYKNMSESETIDVNVNKNKFINVHRNTFHYLTSLYKHYQGQMGDAVQFEELHILFYKEHQAIYNEFVKDGCLNQINISYDSQNELTVLLQDIEKINSFQSFDDFLHLFDAALREVFGLISSMYLYRFKEFVASKTN